MTLSSIASDLQTLISAEQIENACRRLGSQITADYSGLDGQLTIVGTLKGSVLFLSDLLREIDLPLRVDFVELSSYGDLDHTSGSVRINKDLKNPIQGHHVILIEDIVDTGITFHFLYDLMKQREPASVEMACLLKKPDKHQLPYRIRYCGFDIQDHFVVGYGLDYRGLFRNLRRIAILDQETRSVADQI